MRDNAAPAERTSAATRDATPIELGWTVYDELGRPVGNVTEVEGDRLKVDGRPEGLGYLNLPMSAVKRAGDNEVHLTVRTESFGEQARGANGADVRTLTADEETSRVRLTSGAGSGDEDYTGSSYTASGAPIGIGSNTPVGEEPSSFRAWDASVEDRSGWKGWLWLVPAGVAAAGVGGYLAWRREQERRRPINRLRSAVSRASGSIGPAWELARRRPRTAGIAALALIPLLWWLGSSGDEDDDRSDVRDEARERWDRARDRWRSQSWSGDEGRPWLDWSRSLADRRTGDSPAWGWEQDRPSSWWLAALPLVGGLLWLVTRQTRPSRGGGRRGETLGSVMTRGAQMVRPEATVFEAASTMRRLNVGALPVCDGRRLQGMVTDRDIAVRGVADGRDPHLTYVGDVMSSDPVYAFEDDSLAEGAQIMREHQIRRLPIVDRDKTLVGIVSLGDLAVEAGDDALSGETLERISEPARPKR